MWEQLRPTTAEQPDICEIIDAKQWDRLSSVPVGDRRQKLFLFEQVAALVNAGLMNKYLADYMFGYHAIKCWDHAEFWPGLPQKATGYWKLLERFVNQMNKIERDVSWEKRRKRMKF
jgi:hypothetical protein